MPSSSSKPGRAPLRIVPWRQVHGRRTDEAGDEEVGRTVVQLERRADLLDRSVVQHHDAVGHGHGFHLVVGHIDGGGLQPLMQFLDLRAHLHAQLGVEVGERLVEQEHGGIAHDSAAHRHALALPARELPRIAAEIGFEVEDLGRTPHPRLDLRRRRFAHLQRKAHVVRHRLVRIERVGLEHHGDVAVLGLQVVHHPLADPDRPGADVISSAPRSCAAGSTCRSPTAPPGPRTRHRRCRWRRRGSPHGRRRTCARPGCRPPP